MCSHSDKALSQVVNAVPYKQQKVVTTTAATAA
jgi:hypothetical protein